ncbi:hypothetical protein VNO78_05628 [Psophocarpus tetragonolobus]|uniref:Uncharacterized protein n=1 Tax=Psophocarpus tetragonolobus TaxID=3891 RepID=A0AAN9T012_PSOTE
MAESEALSAKATISKEANTAVIDAEINTKTQFPSFICFHVKDAVKYSNVCTDRIAEEPDDKSDQVSHELVITISWVYPLAIKSPECGLPSCIICIRSKRGFAHLIHDLSIPKEDGTAFLEIYQFNGIHYNCNWKEIYKRQKMNNLLKQKACEAKWRG